MSAPSNDMLKTLLLDHYHCTFFLPLLGFGKGLDPKADLKKIYPLNEKLNEADAEAFYYFTPTLRDIVFDRGVPNESGLQAIQEWHLSTDTLTDTLKDWRLELLPSKEQKENAGEDVLKLALVHQTVEFQTVRLYRYFNGIYMLAFTVRPHATQHMYLEAWLRFTRLGRQLYPTFTEQWNEGKIAPLELTTPELAEPLRALDAEVSRHFPKSSEYLSPILIHLAQQFFADDIKQKLKDEIRLFDDRMFVSVAYGLAGEEKLDENKRKRIKALIATTDRFEDTWSEMDGYAYSQTAIDRIIQNTEFDFWADKGGHFIYNDMVNGYLYRDWFFNKIIAPKHIPYIYDRMLIQALFYQASLRHYDHEITVTTKALLNNKDKVNDISKQRGQFIEFTNQYWFREVTNQMQGKEIFRLQQQGLGLQEHYTLLQDEITRTDEYLQALEADNAGKRAHQFTKLAAVLAMVAALPIFNDIFKTEDSLWQSIADSLANTGYLSVFCAKVSLAVLLASLLLITAFYFWRKKD
ncbi:hypothetical protein [Thiothrix lacustris]|uniref:hypothetical protein n=1 Tax=Thiothrix lacustris TaxID=525917 RepID=UPI0027E43C80|nr:hypothetical protein [Thiothrix lacustris]WMP17256.1 hypothetical protein RCS87_18005 [Thiothrix lacustris]